MTPGSIHQTYFLRTEDSILTIEFELSWPEIVDDTTARCEFKLCVGDSTTKRHGYGAHPWQALMAALRMLYMELESIARAKSETYYRTVEDAESENDPLSVERIFGGLTA